MAVVGVVCVWGGEDVAWVGMVWGEGVFVEFLGEGCDGEAFGVCVGEGDGGWGLAVAGAGAEAVLGGGTAGGKWGDEVAVCVDCEVVFGVEG